MSKKAKKVLAICALLGFGVYATVFGANQLIHSRQLATRGRSTTGEVLDTEDRSTRKSGSHTYYVQVKFQPEGGTSVQQRVSVDEDVFLAAQANQSVNVFYLPEDPTVCAVGDKVKLRYGFLLGGIAFLFGAGFLLVFFKAPADVEEAVEEIADQLKPLTLTKHRYAPVEARRFKHLDLAFYDGAQRQLEARGYRFLSDEENISLRRFGIPRTFIRILISADQTVMADLYHFKPGWMFRVLGVKDFKVLDLENWFSDGRFVCTSNAEMAGKLDSPPSIDALRLPAGTTCEMLLEAHQRRVSAYLATHAGVAAVKLKDLADVHRAQEEQQRIKAEFRKKVGLSKTELERIAGQTGKEVDQLHDALTKHRDRNRME